MQSRLVLALWVGCSTVACADGPLGSFPPETEPLVPVLAADDQAEPLFVRVYPVADLVVQPSREEFVPAAFMAVESSPQLTAAPTRPTQPGQSAMEHLAELSVILQSAVLPESWDMSGGPAHVAVHGTSLSLVVRQTAAGHEEVSQVLDELRRSTETEIELTWQVYVDRPSSNHAAVDPDLLPAFEDLATAHASPLAAAESEQLTRTLSEHFAGQPRQRVRLQNGWSARLSDEVGCQAVASADGRSIRIQLEVAATGAVSRRNILCRVPPGRTAVIRLTSAEGAPESLALVSARIASDTAAEEQLAPPESKPLAPTPTVEPTEDATDVAEQPAIQPTVFEKLEHPAVELTTVVFPVADLLPESEPRSTALESLATTLARQAGIEDGNERIQLHPRTLSFVVRSTRDQHSRIAEVLEVLRRASSGASSRMHAVGADAVESSMRPGAAP